MSDATLSVELQLNQRIAELEAELARLARYTTHDHAPCMYCDPLRAELAEARAEIERYKARHAAEYAKNHLGDRNTDMSLDRTDRE